MEPTNELLIKIARIRIEEAQTQLNYGAPAQVLDAARVNLRLAELALVALQEQEKPPAQPVAEVVAWSHPQSPRICDIRALRPDIAPGLLYEAPPELKIREVLMPERYEVEMYPVPSPNGEWYSCDDVLEALADAGISAKKS